MDAYLFVQRLHIKSGSAIMIFSKDLIHRLVETIFISTQMEFKKSFVIPAEH